MTTWTIDRQTAQLKSKDWDVEVQMAHPNIGVTLSANGDSSSSVLSLSPDVLPPLGECYVRQSDLIVRYPEVPPANFGFQLDVKCISESDDRLIIELWASVQTFLLDSYPTIQWHFRPTKQRDLRVMTSSRDNDGLNELNRSMNKPKYGQSLAALVDENRTDCLIDWILMMNPLDECETELCQPKSQESKVDIRLFGGFMEKGVIRRARMRWIVSQHGMTRKNIDDAYSDFCNSPLPLTT